MEENIMTNEVKDVVTEAVAKTEGCGLKMVVVFGAGVLTGFVISKVTKPIKDKIIAKKYAKVCDDADAAEATQEDEEDDSEE